MGYDIVYRGATLYDGSGGPATTADVAVEGDRVAEIGSISAGASRTVDASGLALAPVVPALLVLWTEWSLCPERVLLKSAGIFKNSLRSDSLKSFIGIFSGAQQMTMGKQNNHAASRGSHG